MIAVFFTPGMFGSTIDYVLRTFSQEINANFESDIQSNGSMHNHTKDKHIIRYDKFVDFLKKDDHDISVVTPIYPFLNKKLPAIIVENSEQLDKFSHRILIYADNQEYAEINMLFQYYKIVLTNIDSSGLDIYCNGNEKNITSWNPNYTHWTQMKCWELREWLSLFYPSWTQEWINSQNQVDDTWLTIGTKDILHNTIDTFNKIISYCGLTRNHRDLSAFSEEWKQKQLYVLEEYYLIDQIVSNTITSVDFSWGTLNIIAESIIQQHLRASGFEIKCDGLNVFPTNSITLNNLLIPATIHIN